LQFAKRKRPVPLQKNRRDCLFWDSSPKVGTATGNGFVEGFSLTPGFSRVRKACAAKNRLNGFSLAHLFSPR
jgi:hypothetical protein